jgi:hypothetical protein
MERPGGDAGPFCWEGILSREDTGGGSEAVLCIHLSTQRLPRRPS